MIYTNLLAFLRLHTEMRLFLLTTCSLAIFLKLYFLKIVSSYEMRTKKIHLPWLFLIGVLVGSMFGDIAWVVKLIRDIFLPSINYNIVVFFIRIAWGCLIIHYQSLSLFIESLSEKKFKLQLHHKLLLPLSGAILSYFFYIACFKTSVGRMPPTEQLSNLSIELFMMKFLCFYLLFLVTLPSLYIAVHRIKNQYLPRILRKQLVLFTAYLMGPYIIIEFLQAIQHPIPLREFLYPVVAISTLLLLVSMYACMKKIMGLRFLNYSDHVHTSSPVNLVHDFKDVLEKLSQANNIPELTQITQHFFQDTFGIPLRKIGLYIRTNNKCTNTAFTCCSLQKNVEQMLRNENKDVLTYIQEHRILIYDEIEFSDFYEECETRKSLLIFLNSLNAELFIPIFNKDTITAYIVIENHARVREFYGSIERDEMIIFASYLNHIITLLQTKNINTLMQQEKELQEELFSKIQQINQYKETIRAFIKSNKEKKIGIIFYKNRSFVMGNKEAKELIPININKQEGHILSRNLRNIVQLVKQYNMPHRCITKDSKNDALVLSGVPSLDKNNVIIAVYYPEVTDLLTNQVALLKDPTKWDYLLYLESTQPGKLINQLIPGTGEQLLNFKIKLLKTALGKKATLLEMPKEDLMQVVEVLHHISLREHLHIMDLSRPEKNNEYIFKIFGINPLFAIKTTTTALLKKLDSVGTLFIKNVHFLSLESQNHLAECIRYGYYRAYKSAQKHPCNVRIIVSTDQDLLNLVHNNLFSQELYNELKKAKLSLPSLSTLPEDELTELAKGITEQALQSQEIKSAIELTAQEKSRLSLARPISISELRTRIKKLLEKKAKPATVYHETQIDTEHPVNDLELSYAAQLGRHALRSSKIMKLLWHTFKNQNKIASFLGVNRSSVNRRCKQYNLE